MQILKKLFDSKHKENNKPTKENKIESQILSNKKGEITISNQAINLPNSCFSVYAS